MLRKLAGMGLVVFAGACGGGQDTAEPCVWRLDVLGGANLNVGASVTLRSAISTRSGTCTGKEPVSWITNNPTNAEIFTSNDSTAVIRGKNTGSATIVAFLTRIPTVRDSTTFQVVIPKDN
ncbi:MAG TPA: hypothetical protein VM100_04710 [Longimicrobiales bacterium]|nr:hypothetical protein [Longimicrobiales bacterium]